MLKQGGFRTGAVPVMLCFDTSLGVLTSITRLFQPDCGVEIWLSHLCMLKQGGEQHLFSTDCFSYAEHNAPVCNVIQAK